MFKYITEMGRPRIGRDCNEEVWNTFLQKWTMFVDITEISESEKLHQLYQCCGEDLGDAILKDMQAL